MLTHIPLLATSYSLQQGQLLLLVSFAVLAWSDFTISAPSSMIFRAPNFWSYSILQKLALQNFVVVIVILKVFPQNVFLKKVHVLHLLLHFALKVCILHTVQDHRCQTSWEIVAVIECLTILQMGQYW